MDDLTFRRRILSNPCDQDEELQQAIAMNSRQQQFALDIHQLDAQIKQTMSINTPDGLEKSILSKTNLVSNTLNSKDTRKSKQWLSLVASVAFLAGILAGQLQWQTLFVSPAHASLAQTAIEHVHAEKNFIQSLDEQAPTSQINAKLSPFHYQFLQQFPYHVYYLNHCGFADTNAMHLVFQGEKGKVTLFITSITPSNPQTHIEQSGMQATVKPLGQNSMIIVGDTGEDIDKIYTKLTHLLTPM